MFHPTPSPYWKEEVVIIFWLLFEMIAASVPFITWLVELYLISKWQNIKPQADSDHVAGGNNNLIPEDALETVLDRV